MSIHSSLIQSKSRVSCGLVLPSASPGFDIGRLVIVGEGGLIAAKCGQRSGILSDCVEENRESCHLWTHKDGVPECCCAGCIRGGPRKECL